MSVQWNLLGSKTGVHYPFALLQDVVRIANTFVSNVLDLKMQQKEEREWETRPQGDDEDVGKAKPRAFLDHLLSSKEGQTLTKEELSGELKHLVAAANSTTSDTLSFFLYCVAIRQDIQDRILEVK